MSTGAVDRGVRRRQTIDGLPRDWVMVVLCTWFLGGVYLDGWAHTHGICHAYLVFDIAIGGRGKGGRLLVADANGADAKVRGKSHDVLNGTSRQTEEGRNTLTLN